MLARTLVPLKAIGNAAHLGTHPVGTIFEGDQALFFVKVGACEPMDEECQAAHGYNQEQMADVQLAYRASAAGIWPEDFRKFRDGVIAGYDMDGNFLPGPNWCEPDPEEDDDE